MEQPAQRVRFPVIENGEGPGQTRENLRTALRRLSLEEVRRDLMTITERLHTQSLAEGKPPLKEVVTGVWLQSYP